MKKKCNVYLFLKMMLCLFLVNICTIEVFANENLPRVEGSSKYGSVYWESSNLREWLNSAEDDVRYTSGSPSYKNEAGFLNQFTDKEIDAIAITEHREVLMGIYRSIAEYGRSGPTHANNYEPYLLMNDGLRNMAINNENYYYKACKDKVYLLGIPEAYWYVLRRGNVLHKSITEEAKIKNNITTQGMEWWLDGGTERNGDERKYATSNRTAQEMYATNKMGVVPVINIKPSYIFKDGRKASNLRIGDTVTFGKYLSKDILWEVINVSDEGYPLLLSVNVLDVKEFNSVSDSTKRYSEYINYDTYDVSLMKGMQYKSTKMDDDINIPTLEIVNRDILNVRQNESVTLKFKVTDDLSGIDYVILPDGTQSKDLEFELTFTQNNSYYIQVMDISGNYHVFLVKVSNINESPYVNVTASTNEWTNQDVSVNVTTSNEVRNGFETLSMGYGFRKEISSSYFPNYKSYIGSEFLISGKIQMTNKPENVSLINKIGFQYYSTKENSSSYGTCISLNSVSALDVPLSDIWNSSNHQYEFNFKWTIPASYADNLKIWLHSGFNDYNTSGCVLKYTDIEYELVDDSDFAITKIELPNGADVYEGKYVDTISAEGVNSYTYVVHDNRGKKTTKTITTKIDKTKAELEIENSVTYMTNKDIVLKIRGSDSLSGISKIITPTSTVNVSGDRNKEISFTVSQNNNYEFKVVDVAGNETVKRISISNIDKVKPTVTISGVLDKWYNQAAMVKLIATDNSNMITKIEYSTTGVMSCDWKEYISDISINTSGITTVKARAYDAAGNISDVVSISVKVDLVNPEGKFSIAEFVDSRNVEIAVSGLKDEHSNVNKIEVSNYSDFSQKTVSQLGNSNDYKIAFVLDKKSSYDENYSKRTIYVRLYDNAGNVSEYRIYTTVNPNGNYSAEITNVNNNQVFSGKEPVLIKWTYNGEDVDFGDMIQKKADIIVTNKSTGDVIKGTVNGTNKSYRVNGLDNGEYSVKVIVYFADRVSIATSSFNIRYNVYNNTGNVVTKQIDVMSPLSFVSISSDTIIPKGTSIEGKIKYTPVGSDELKEIEFKIESNSKETSIIKLPNKASNLTIEYTLKNKSSDKSLTPYLDAIKIYGR